MTEEYYHDGFRTGLLTGAQLLLVILLFIGGLWIIDDSSGIEERTLFVGETKVVEERHTGIDYPQFLGGVAVVLLGWFLFFYCMKKIGVAFPKDE